MKNDNLWEDSQINNEDRFNIFYKDNIFESEIKSFSQNFKIKNTGLQQFWSIVCPCLCGYLIRRAYINSLINRVQNCDDYFSSSNKVESTLNEKDFIYLRDLDIGYSNIKLIYHIKDEKLLILKTKRECDFNLFQSEYENYLNVSHPFLLKFYGTVEYNSKKWLILDYINGFTINDFLKLSLNFKEKIKIIFELMIIIEYLHNKKYIYRDLKPQNLMIDHNKMLILIDLDRMVKKSDGIQNINLNDLSGDYLSPELFNGSKYSYETDIYSLGKIIFYLFKKEFKSDNIPQNLIQIYKLYMNCIDTNPDKRPNISELIDSLYEKYFANRKNVSETDTIKSINNIHQIKYMKYWFLIAENNNDKSQVCLGKMYEEGVLFPKNWNKSIKYYLLASKKGNVEAQYKLGKLYYLGREKDIEKATFYLTLAAKHNIADACYLLGEIYQTSNIKNVNKALHYYFLASKQNHPKAQYNLGLIYLNGECTSKNINKAIHYFNLAAEENDPESLGKLGDIYLNGIDVKKDINKAIYYLTLAANLNHPYSQFMLGTIYCDDANNCKDIDKAIYYFNLAANQNFKEAQHNLGQIYLNIDINKAILYFKLAANQNHGESLCALGYVYSNEKFGKFDMKKAIYYYSLASDQNNSNAQFLLGQLYYEGKYVNQDIKKSIYYYTLSANQNNSSSLFPLALIYLDGEFVQQDIKKSLKYLSLLINKDDSNVKKILKQLFSNIGFLKNDIDAAMNFFILQQAKTI